MKRKNLILIILVVFSYSFVLAQVESSTLTFKRGKLWQSVSYTKVGPSYSDWRRIGIGLDWPGFDPSLINESIGGAPSHLVSGGFYVGCKGTNDSVVSVEDWSVGGSSISTDASQKYIITKHTYLYPNGSNHWLQSNPNVGEEVIETIWEYNMNYNLSDQYQVRRMMPIRVTRLAHQWSGSKLDENYIIYEYIFKNIADEIHKKIQDNPTLYPPRYVADTLIDFYALVNYGMHSNNRSWTVLFPNESPGARNLQFDYDNKCIFCNANNSIITGLSRREDFGLAPSMGPLVTNPTTGLQEPSGEYLAPAFVGIKLLYASRNKNSQESYIKQYGWVAGSNSADWGGPMANVGDIDSKYEVLKDITKVPKFIASKRDTVYMGKNRIWTWMSLGPWDLLPGDSIKIVLVEAVDGIDYGIAIQPNVLPYSDLSVIRKISKDNFEATLKRAELTYKNNFNHPDPPGAPEFTIDYFRESQFVANVLEWGTETEQIQDPDDLTNDLVGYVIYRSEYLPIGPWTPIDTVLKGDLDYLEGATYIFVDSTVDVGKSYYYALTAYDAGKASWVGSFQTITNVPPMESSIFANRLEIPFVATLPPRDNLSEVLVVPNPFILGEGRSMPGQGDVIQFVNIPNPCTIRIYTVRGDLVKTIEVGSDDGGIVSWDQVTDYGQFIESGIYLFHVDSKLGEKLGKFAIIR
ncbi:MAG: hypothetical protein JXA68_07950 [Ignavibacteriales bacterium]|nr:hypothetical protein [Ignavibacteriales bacterium]